MSAFNLFFAQLTGGGTSSSTAGGGSGAEQQSRDGGSVGAAGGVGAGDGAGSSTGRRGSGSGSGSVGAGSRDRDRGSTNSDAFGVPLKGAAVKYDPGSDRNRFGTPQCESVATLPEASMRRGLCGQGALVAANADFVCYSIKSSIRVIYRSTGARALIKMTGMSAEGSPQDMSLMSTFEYSRNASSLLACSTSAGDVLVWELQVRTPGTASSSARGAAAVAAAGAAAVEVSTAGFLCLTGANAQSVKWHPAGGGYRYLAVISGREVAVCDVAALHASASTNGKVGAFPTIALEPASAAGARVPGPVCTGHSQQVTDVSFSAKGAILATAGEDGIVKLWDARVALLQLKPPPEALTCLCAFRAGSTESKLSRVLVVDEDETDGMVGNSQTSVVTGDQDNRLLKIWVAPTRLPSSPNSPSADRRDAGRLEGLLPLQVLSLPGRGALALEADPGGEFVFAADTAEGLLYAVHLGEGNYGIRMDYLRPYALAHPVQGFGVLEQAPEPEYGYDEQDLPSGEGRVLQLICVQTKPVQIYRIAARDALPPPGTFLEGEEEEDEEDAEADLDADSAVSAPKLRAESDSSAVSKDAGGILDAVGGGNGSGGGRSGVKFEKKLDVADEPLGPLTSNISSEASPQGASSGLPPPRARATPAGDFNGTTEGAGRGAGVMVGDGAGGGSAAKKRGDDAVGISTAGDAVSGGSPSMEASSAQSTPEGWEGAAQDDWDQDSGDHCNAVAAAAAAATPTTAGGDSLSETSSSGGGGDAPPPPPRRAIPPISSGRASASGATAAPSVSPRPIAKTSGPEGASPRHDGSPGSKTGVGGAEEVVVEKPSVMPSAAPQERPAPPEYRRFLTPHELESFGTPSSAEASARPPHFGALDSSIGGDDNDRELSLGARGDSHEHTQEQSVSVSVSEERQEVGATTTEGTATAAGLITSTADTIASTGAGVGQATGTDAVFSSSGGESTDASYQGGGEGMGGGGDGGGAGAGEPSASGSVSGGLSGLSAHGDASGGSSSTSAMQQLGSREADNSAGAAAFTSQHPLPSPARSSTSVAGADTGSALPDPSVANALQSTPPPPPSAVSFSPTAGGEASKDPGGRRSGRGTSGINVDQSATLVLRSLLMHGNSGGGGTSASGGGGGGGTWGTSSGTATGPGQGGSGAFSSAAAPMPRADAEGAGAGIARPLLPPASSSPLSASKPTTSVGRVAYGAGSGPSAPTLAYAADVPPLTSAWRPSSPSPAMESDHPRAGTLAYSVEVPPLNSVWQPSSPSPAMASDNPRGGFVAYAAEAPPLIMARPPSPPSPAMQLDTVASNASTTGKNPDVGTRSPTQSPHSLIDAAGRGGGGARVGDLSSASTLTSSVKPSASSAAVSAMEAGGEGMSSGALSSGNQVLGIASDAGASAMSRVAPPAEALLAQHGSARNEPQSFAEPGAGTDGSMRHNDDGIEEGVPGAESARSGADGSSVDQEALAEAVTSRVVEEMTGSIQGLQEFVSQVVVTRCREGVAEAIAASQGTKDTDRAALVGDISASVDRTLRRGMAETVATPLAKLVVNTAHQIVADPLQASLATLHGQQQRSNQASAAAAHAGAQAGAQAAATSQAATLARAQTGNVRRELLECKEELGRAVTTSVQEPVGAAFRECFEGQLIPRVQTAVNRMFEQINHTLTRGLESSPLVNSRAGVLSDDVTHVRARVDGLESGLRDVTVALSNLGEQMDRLASAVEAQGEAQAQATRAAAQAAQAGPVPAVRAWTVSTPPQERSPPPLALDPRDELHALLIAGRLEEAMNKALSASDLTLVMWLCGRLDSSFIPPQLPQHILLCLLQQLGTSDLLEGTTAKLQWLQNCALAIDPAETKIRVHLPLVLDQLRNALTQALPTIANRGGPDVGVLRMTTHVVNSLRLTAGATQSPGAAAASTGVQ